MNFADANTRNFPNPHVADPEMHVAGQPVPVSVVSRPDGRPAYRFLRFPDGVYELWVMRGSTGKWEKRRETMVRDSPRYVDYWINPNHPAWSHESTVLVKVILARWDREIELQ